MALNIFHIVNILKCSKILHAFSITMLITTCNLATAQSDIKKWSGGICVGGNYSLIEDLDQTVLSEPFFINYTLDSVPGIGFNIGGFLNYRGFFKNLFGVRLEAIYSQQGSDLEFNNSQTDFNYKIQFKYQYINFNLLLKGYFGNIEDPGSPLLARFNLYTGLGVGVNSTHQTFIINLAEVEDLHYLVVI